MNKAAGKKRLCILILAAALVLHMAGCSTATSATVKSDEPAEPAQAEGQAGERERTAKTDTEKPSRVSATGETQEVYKTIIDAYINSEKSGFTSFDPVIADTFLATAQSQSSDMTGIGVEIAELSLSYATWDMNADGVPELFIIAGDSYDNYIWGVYTIADNAPCSLLQQGGAREEIRLHVNESGEGVIVHEWSHMGEVVDLLYSLPKGGAGLVLEEGLYTDWNDAAQNEAYEDLENYEIINYGDHYRGADSLYPNLDELTPISMSDWESIWGGLSAAPVDFTDIYPLSDYPAGF